MMRAAIADLMRVAAFITIVSGCFGEKGVALVDLPFVLNDRYKLTERLGEGGMAEVYKGEDLRLGREVAVKVLRPQYAADPGFLRRFQNEGRAVASFGHPNIVNVFDIGQDRRLYYIVMEHVPGSDLRDLIQKEGKLDVVKALNIGKQIALGVGCAHSKGLIHRDIKPGNILITPKGEVKVADFGIAKALAGASLTEPGIVWGTTAYLSPEQIRGEQATKASDVYSIGVVLYEMLAGVAPFAGDDRVAVALQHLRDQPAPLAERNHQVTQRVQEIVDRALAKDPAARYGNGDEMAKALSDCLREGFEAASRRPKATNSRNQAAEAPPAAQTPQVPQATPARRVEAAPVARREREAAAAPVEEVVRPARRPARALPPEPQRAMAVDPWSVVLAVILVLMIAGLFPLYWLVYTRYLGDPGLWQVGSKLVTSLWMTFLL
jgi:serine/threonine protein kinase